jgi:hypothetical protein
MRAWLKPPGQRRICAILLRTIRTQQSLWDAVLAPGTLRLPPALAELDRYLDDPRFF